ncbi:hypothetical protein R1flu_011743 [Riccia fluitans]|uniref:Myb-like domain-containing protein n=1 Tax=Riccia fluitans TaxID=41844 RepID=A0ABD1Z8M8_9MARC
MKRSGFKWKKIASMMLEDGITDPIRSDVQCKKRWDKLQKEFKQVSKQAEVDPSGLDLVDSSSLTPDADEVFGDSQVPVTAVEEEEDVEAVKQDTEAKSLNAERSFNFEREIFEFNKQVQVVQQIIFGKIADALVSLAAARHPPASSMHSHDDNMHTDGQ